jgi:hypothetical protein
MRELDRAQEAVFAECLRILDEGASIDECLTRYPDGAETLRPLLELHARLLASEKPAAPASAYDAGRQALLARVASAPVARKRPLRELVASPLRGRGLRSPTLARAATAAALLVLLAGGALGASAAAGVGKARDALSVLPFVAPSGHGPGDGGIGSTPTSVLPGQDAAGTDAPRGTPHGPPTDVPRGTPHGPPTDVPRGTPHGPPTDVPRGTPHGPPTDVPRGTPHGPPTDVPRATHTPPGQSHRETPHPPTVTPPGQSHRQTPQGPRQTPPGH